MGIPWTTSLDFRRPLWGFSIKYGMSKWLARSNTFFTSLSEPSRSRGVFAVVRALEYMVHNGDAQTASGFPCFSIISGVTSKILQQMVGFILLSQSRLVHVQPCCSNTLEILLVPQKSSSKWGISVGNENICHGLCTWIPKEHHRYDL
jgi:hypothetical protein